MLPRFPRSSVAIQSIFLTACAFVFFLHVHGLVFNVVMRNYYIGGLAFIRGLDPYTVTLANGLANQFKYSPLFGVLMAGMAKVTYQPSVIGFWVLFGMAAFSFGLSRWSDLIRKMPIYMIVALLAALLDLVVSMAAYQTNALIIGLILLGLAEYRDGRFFTAGAILLLATNFKVYPVIFLVSLALLFRPRYWIGALCAGIAALLLPAIFVGWAHNLEMHLAWFRVVFGDSTGAGVLDLLAAFQRVGLNDLGQILRWFVLVTTIPLFFSYLPLAERFDWRPWMTFGLAALLLLSPRTEVFTYVLLAPSYVLMASWCAESGQKSVRAYGGALVAVLAVAIASCRYIDSKWFVSESPLEIVRVIGALGFWVITAGIVGNAILKSLKVKLAGTADARR
jgi:hypothetical protein